MGSEMCIRDSSNKVTFCQLQKKEQILNLDRVNGWTGRSPSQRVRADGRIAISESTGGREITISESTGGLVDRHLREYWQTGGSPSQRVRVDWRIAISESTADRQIAG